MHSVQRTRENENSNVYTSLKTKCSENSFLKGRGGETLLNVSWQSDELKDIELGWACSSHRDRGYAKRYFYGETTWKAVILVPTNIKTYM
jgi:hypothetical protein